MKNLLIVILLSLFMYSCNAGEFDDPMGNPKRAEWMSGKYGMMTHYLPSPVSGNDLGAYTTPEERAKLDQLSEEEKTEIFNRIVDGFDLKLYMKQFDQSGADYLIFTVGQNTKYYTSYNSVIEKVTPGHCSKRDLVMEIAKEVKKRKKGFIFYIPCDSRWIDDGSGYYETWAKVCEEYSKKMGKLCDGWWIDGCNVNEVNGPVGEKLAIAMRSGNPKSALAFSDASFAGNSLKTTIKWNDYFPGEVHVVEDGYIRHDCLFPHLNPYLDENGYVRIKHDVPEFFVPEEKYLDGVLLHALVPMDLTFNPAVLTEWVPYKDKDNIALAHSFTEVGGAITFNVPIGIDGKIPQSSLNKLITIGKSYKGANKNKKYPLDPEVLKRSVLQKKENPDPLNIAYGKPSKLLTWDCTQEAPASAGSAKARKGNDGIFETGAAAAYNWKWTYELDLEKECKVSRIEVSFYGGFATDFDIYVSGDKENWNMIKHYDNPNGELKFVLNTDVSFRYIRVRSNKPDDEGQKGGQMCIGELQIFE